MLLRTVDAAAKALAINHSSSLICRNRRTL
jgi:hypothetical protein